MVLFNRTILFNGTKVYNPNHPRNGLFGGRVRGGARFSKRQMASDSVWTILQPNELIIPVRYKGRKLAAEVQKALMAQGVMLPGFRKK
jgi:hypothetical protein